MVGLRDQINQKPAVAGVVVLGVVLALVAVVYSQLRPNHPSKSSGMQRYYTTDDGRSWFDDAWEQVPPFDHNGSQAVLCFVFKTSNSPAFAGYLETYTPKMHDLMTSAARSNGSVVPDTGALVKRPGDKNWVPLGSSAGQKITIVKSPDGSAEPPQPVYP
jgi:hypothetical protein